MRRLGTLAAVASIALIAACGSNDGADDTTAVPEEGSSSESSSEATNSAVVSSRWVLQKVETADVSVQTAKNTKAWLQIAENGEVTGSTGCNGFGGSATVGDGVVTFQPLIATKKGCSGELAKIDTAMLGTLRGEVSTEVSGDTLTITSDAGEVLTLRMAKESAENG